MTAKSAFPTLDMLHLGLMLVALILAYILPFELVLLSYAVLGPMHYLTEISWLHQRSYFLSQRWLAWFLVVCTAFVLVWQMEREIAGMLLYSALAFSVAFSIFKTTQSRVLVIAGGIATGYLVTRVAPVNVPIVILLPTVIHVSLFTFLFMLVGALRSKSWSQMLLVIAYIISIGVIMVLPPTASIQLPDLASIGPRFFGTIGPAMGQIFGPNVWPFDARLAGFLSFIYTYHYLNWFIKVRVIKWNEVPKERLLVIAILGVGATSLYFVSYALGLVVLVTISLLHVLLEFPLNVISMRELGRMVLPRRSAAP